MSNLKTYGFSATRLLRETGYFSVEAESLEDALIEAARVANSDEWSVNDSDVLNLPPQFVELED
jgi:hypothetical protein